jgi:hypothetical protein
LLNASVKISASKPEVIRIAKTNQTRALKTGADLQAMVIVKSHIACTFVNLLNRQIKSPHFQIFVTNLQVDLDFIAPTLEAKLNG